MMKKTTRILALIGAVLLIALYVSTLFFALMDTATAATLLKISVAATIILPVLLYGYILIYRLTNKGDEDSDR